MSDVHRRLYQSVNFSRAARRLQRDEEARKIWRAVYPQLSEAKPGLLGAILSRSEAHVTRLSCIYALLDSSTLVRKEHLLAALAVWVYAQASASYIFGNRMIDDVENRIHEALRIRKSGMTKTDIHSLYSRHAPREKIETALANLLNNKAVYFVYEKDTTGRSVKRFFNAN